MTVADAGKVAAAKLADVSKHVNKAYTIVSNHHSYSDAAKAFSKALGKQVTNTTILMRRLQRVCQRNFLLGKCKV